MTRTLTLAFALLTVALCAACSSPPDRNPVPLELVGRAVVPGMPPDVRSFGDDDPDTDELRKVSAELEEDLRSRDATESAHLHWLAMSGGAADGAFGAGLLNGWTDAGTRPEFQLVTGVSTGALTAPFVFLGSDYDSELERFYTEIRADQLLKQRSLFSIIGNVSAADSAPLRALLEELITAEMLSDIAREHARGRRLLISTSNLDADRPILWDLGEIATVGTPEALRLFHDAVLASASVPGVFPPVFIDVEVDGVSYDEMHVDGGLHNQVALLPPAVEIREVLRDAGVDPLIDLWVIRNRPVTPEYAAVDAEIVSILSRSMTVTTRSQGIGDVYRLYLVAVRDQLRFHLAAIPPDFREPREEEFDPVYMRKLFDRGRELGRTGEIWADAPPGFESGQLEAGDDDAAPGA